jgi:hypothetical protein
MPKLRDPRKGPRKHSAQHGVENNTELRGAGLLRIRWVNPVFGNLYVTGRRRLAGTAGGAIANADQQLVDYGR